MSTTHSAVITIRCRPELKEALFAAACRQGQSVSKFVLTAALAAALADSKAAAPAKPQAK